MRGRRLSHSWFIEPSKSKQVDRAAGHGVCSVSCRVLRLYGAVALFCLFFTAPSRAAEPASGRELLPANAAVVVEVRQPQALAQHALLRRALAILDRSRAFQAALGSPDLDLVRDAISQVETEFGIPALQILDSCAGEGIWASAVAETPAEICVIVTGREPDRVARLPAVTLSLARRMLAGRGIVPPDPTARTYEQHTYHQIGDACYAVVGRRWLLSNREASLKAMLDRLDGRQPLTSTGTPKLLTTPAGNGAGVSVAADLKILQKQPGLAAAFKWPPPQLGLVIAAGGWFDLVQRSDHVVAELDFANDAVQAHVRLPAPPTSLTPGTVGYFASEPATSAAPLLEPARLIYSASWYRDYWKMWEQRDAVPLKDDIKKLEQQLASTQTGNLGYSAFDILRLLGPHFRFVVTRPTPSPYRVAVTDRLPEFAIVFDVRNEAEFREKVLPPIQRILGIVAITNKMIAQNTPYKTAEVSAMKFAEDAASVMNSDRVRYNFEPTYSLTRGHLVVGSTGAIVRSLIDELDRLQAAPVTQSPSAPGPTERQVLRFGELAGVVEDVHGLSLRNAVLNDGLTIAEAGAELGILQQLVSALGQLQVQAGFDPRGFEYRIQLAP